MANGKGIQLDLMKTIEVLANDKLKEDLLKSNGVKYFSGLIDSRC